MRSIKIPTLIGIVILIIGIVAGVVLIQYRQIFKLGAAGEAAPKDVRVTNVTDTSFTVSWITNKVASGAVLFGESGTNLDRAEEDELGAGFTHTATLRNLKPQATYSFKINSGGESFDESGVPWNIKTGATISDSPKSNLISGSLFAATGEPTQASLVYVAIGGTLLSTTTSKNGSWVIQLSNARSLDLSNYLEIDEKTTLLEISANAGPEGVSQAKVYPQSARPIPLMILGQTYDLRSLGPSQNPESPEASVEIPEGPSEGESGFVVPSAQPAGTTKTVTLESIDEGEIVTSTTPEFFGEGPEGTAITIKVESEAQTTQLKIPSSGDWKWSPPAGLSEGVHKITITWKDTKGITRTLTKTFIVQAAEGPAFVATPSATPTGPGTPTASGTGSPKSTTSPTPSASASATPTVTASATAFPQPESGGLTPTLLFSILGIGAFAISFVIWKYSDA